MSFHTTIHEGAPLELKSETEGQDEGQTGDLAATVTAALEGIRTDLSARLSALETKAEATDRRLSRPGIITTPAEAPGALERKAFNTFLRRGVERMTQDETKGLIVGNDSFGGYLVPPELGSEILKRLVEFSPIRQYARVVPISAGEVRYPVRANGATASWVSEQANRPETFPSYGQKSIKVYELATFIEVSNALLEDNAYDLEGELSLEFAEAFGKAESSAFAIGTGTDQPRGVFSPTITIGDGITEIKTGQAADFKMSNPSDNIMDLFHALPTAHAQNAVWMMNRKTMNVLRKWKDADGRYLLANPIAEKMPSTILGRPVVECVDAPDIAANAVPVMFADLSGYRVFDRVELQTLRDPFSQAARGMVRFHARRRVGADVTHADRFARLKIAA